MIARRPMNVNAIAEKFDVSRQAVSLHVQMLSECGLIAIKKRGRERVCEARLHQLDEVSAWVDQQKKFWSAKLDALEKFLDDDLAGQVARKKTNLKNKKR